MSTIRIKLRVWTDPETDERYVVLGGYPVDTLNDETEDWRIVVLNSDGESKIFIITATEWRELPSFYFIEDGEAVIPQQIWSQKERT